MSSFQEQLQLEKLIFFKLNHSNLLQKILDTDILNSFTLYQGFKVSIADNKIACLGICHLQILLGEINKIISLEFYSQKKCK